MDFKIRAVRADEWEQLRELRLAALQDAPAAFGETYAEAQALPDDNWQARAAKGARPESRVLVAQAPDGRWVGTARLGLAEASTAEEPLPAQVDVLPVAEIMGVFIRPEHRGGGDAPGPMIRRQHFCRPGTVFGRPALRPRRLTTSWPRTKPGASISKAKWP